MSKKVCFPICYGRGRCRVTIYNRTTALPYYRISYQLGTIRHQRTFKTLKDAKAYAKEVSAKLRSKDISLAQITKILIIGSEEEVLAQRYRSNMLPKALLGSLYAFEMRYDIPVVWTADPDSAAKLIERWAQRFVTEITKVSFNVNCGKKPPSLNSVL